ncbi:MAG TPA: rhombosortase [Lacipirellula sp.]
MNTARVWTFDHLAMPLAIVALAMLAHTSPQLTASWELDRTAVAAGEWTRLVTGHLTHWNGDHLFWDAATFFALGVVCLGRRPLLTLACLLLSSFAISATFLAVHPGLPTYRGLSGLDTALFTFLAVVIYQDARVAGDRALGAVAKWALAGLVVKTAYEVVTGDTLFVDSAAADFVPLATVHAAGAAVGFLVALAPACIRVLNPTTSHSSLRLRASPRGNSYPAL